MLHDEVPSQVASRGGVTRSRPVRIRGTGNVARGLLLPPLVLGLLTSAVMVAEILAELHGSGELALLLAVLVGCAGLILQSISWGVWVVADHLVLASWFWMRHVRLVDVSKLDILPYDGFFNWNAEYTGQWIRVLAVVTGEGRIIPVKSTLDIERRSIRQFQELERMLGLPDSSARFDRHDRAPRHRADRRRS